MKINPVAAIVCTVAAMLLMWHSGSRAATGDDLSSVELRRAEQKAQTCSAANATGVGLKGEYFASGSMRGVPLLSRIDGPVELDATLDWPASAASTPPRSVRWTGWIRPPITGPWRLHLNQPGSRIQVAQQDVQMSDGQEAPIELSAGRYYPIVIEMPRLVAGPSLRLEWTGPHGLRFLVPKALLFPPTDTLGKATR